MRRVVSALVIPAALCAAGVAAGQPAKADALFREGREAMKRSDYRVACAKFEESQKADPADGTLVNLAVCEDKSGRAADAYVHVRAALKQLPASDPVYAIAKSLADKLQPKLIVDVPKDAAAVEGLQVTHDDHELARSAWGKPIDSDPGEHVVVVTAPGFRTWEKSVTLAAGAPAVTVVVSGLERGASAPRVVRGARTSAPPPRDAGSDPGAGQRTVGTVLVIGGAAAGISAFLFWKSSLSHDEDARAVCTLPEGKCPPSGIDSTEKAQRDGKRAAILGAVGLVAVAAGATLYLLAPDATPKGRSARLWVSPGVDRGSSSLTIGGAW